MRTDETLCDCFRDDKKGAVPFITLKSNSDFVLLGSSNWKIKQIAYCNGQPPAPASKLWLLILQEVVSQRL